MQHNIWYNNSARSQNCRQKKQGKENAGIKKAKTITNEVAKRIREHLSDQDKLIWDISVETGLRIGDILDIRAATIGEVMYIKERKTNKHRIIELSEGLLMRLEPLKRAAGGKRHIYAFPSSRAHGRPINRSTYHRHLKSVCRALDVDFSAHSTRRLYARNIFDDTRNIHAVQEALNHKYVTTTAEYLDINLSALISSALK